MFRLRSDWQGVETMREGQSLGLGREVNRKTGRKSKVWSPRNRGGELDVERKQFEVLKNPP